MSMMLHSLNFAIIIKLLGNCDPNNFRLLIKNQIPDLV